MVEQDLGCSERQVAERLAVPDVLQEFQDTQVGFFQIFRLVIETVALALVQSDVAAATRALLEG